MEMLSDLNTFCNGLVGEENRAADCVTYFPPVAQNFLNGDIFDFEDPNFKNSEEICQKLMGYD